MDSFYEERVDLPDQGCTRMVSGVFSELGLIQHNHSARLSYVYFLERK